MTSQMNCQDVRDQLLEYLEHELADAQRARLDAHLRACDDCRRELQALTAVQQSLQRDTVPDPGAAFWGQFPDQVWRAYQKEQAAHAANRPGTRLRAARARLAAWLAPPVWAPVAALAVIATLALLFVRETGEPSGAAAFQARIHSGESLAVLAQRSGGEGAADTHYGFAPPGQTNFFRLGHWYAESLAYAGSDPQRARAQLTAIARTLPAPPAALLAVTQGEARPTEVAALEPALDQVAHQAGVRDHALFRTGSWVTSVALAVAARDRDALHLSSPVIARLAEELQQSGGAPGAVRDLRALAQLLGHDALTAQDYTTAQQLIRQVRTVLM